MVFSKLTLPLAGLVALIDRAHANCTNPNFDFHLMEPEVRCNECLLQAPALMGDMAGSNAAAIAAALDPTDAEDSAIRNFCAPCCHGEESTEQQDAFMARALIGSSNQELVALRVGLAGYSGSAVSKECEKEKDACNSSGADSSTRRYNGRCNNLSHPSWGSAGESMPRGFTQYSTGAGHEGGTTDAKSGQCSACYDPDRWDDWVAAIGSATPPPLLRDISTAACTSSFGSQGVDNMDDFGVPGFGVPDDTVRSDAAITWAQLMDHDLDATNTDDDSCGHDAPATYEGIDRSCINAKNGITSYVDAGVLYGENMCERNKLFHCVNDACDGASTKFAKYSQGSGANELGMYLPTATDNFGCGGNTAACKICASGKKCHKSESEVFMANPTRRSCFYAGDFRAGENPALVGYHTLLLRLHNYYVRVYEQANWTFEDVRTQVIADEQNITYNEWLPAYTGAGSNGYAFTDTSIDKASLGVGGIRYDIATSYQNIRGSVRQQFATGTFRQHTAVSAKMVLMSNDELELDQTYFESCIWFASSTSLPGCTKTATHPNNSAAVDSDTPGAYIQSLCDLLGGQSITPMRLGDTQMVTEERNQLFYKKNFAGNYKATSTGTQGVANGESGSAAGWEGDGGDLAKANMFRGRDHNLAVWNAYATEYFGGGATNQVWPSAFCKANSASVQCESENSAAGTAVQSAYGGSSQTELLTVDLWLGALAERKLKNYSFGQVSALGSTLTRDVVTQFADLQFGDRFFGTNKISPMGFHTVLSTVGGTYCTGTPFNKFAVCSCTLGEDGGDEDDVTEDDVPQDDVPVNTGGSGNPNTSVNSNPNTSVNMMNDRMSKFGAEKFRRRRLQTAVAISGNPFDAASGECGETS